MSISSPERFNEESGAENTNPVTTDAEREIQSLHDTPSYYFDTSLAECSGKDPNIFFPSTSVGVFEAKLICARCVIRDDCLIQAIEENEDNGVWGGASERDRRRIKAIKRREHLDTRSVTKEFLINPEAFFRKRRMNN